jgi:hypothetical protein
MVYVVALLLHLNGAGSGAGWICKPTHITAVLCRDMSGITIFERVPYAPQGSSMQISAKNSISHYESPALTVELQALQ